MHGWCMEIHSLSYQIKMTIIYERKKALRLYYNLGIVS